MHTYISPEPNKYAAASLALLVHGGFFVLLYFGFNWQSQVPAGMTVEIWQSLPDTPVVTAPKVVPVPVASPKVEPVIEPPKAEIELLDKKKPKPEPSKIKPPEPVKISPPAPVQAVMDKQAVQRAEAQLQAAAMGLVMNEFVAKIRAKIKRNVVLPPDVSNTILAEFEVTLLPGGTVLDARLKKSSGNVAYDTAVERAILKAQPLPLPPDVALFNRFRELNLKFSSAE
jgi:colicin import membrane protein